VATRKHYPFTMPRKRRSRSFSRYLRTLVSGWLRGARVRWYRRDNDSLVFGAVVALLVGGLVTLLFALHVYRAEQRDLACLARNVYFEARGEPPAGQYAVAEVTMNRVASPAYPRSVCEVVYEKRWDAIRNRYVGAFSWTEFEQLPEPQGEEWQRAWQIAEAVYFHRGAAKLDGATHYHATYVRPSWSREKRKVAHIGRHVFYK